MKWCLVGNSDNLLNQELGGEIDKFDCVVRFNRAPVEGYEKHVGSKSTHRFINRIVCNMQKQMPTENITIDSRYDNQHYILDIENPKLSEQVFFKNFPKATSFETISRPQEVKNLYKTFKGLPPFTRPNPTVGFAMVCYCLNRNLDFTIVGFGVNQPPSSAPHYWERKTYKSGHDYDCERNILNLLIGEGYIKLLEP